MKIEALKTIITQLPKAKVFIELQDGKRIPATGFHVRDDEAGEPVIIIIKGGQPK